MNNVQTLRKKLNLTQDGFAEYCGLSRISIQRYESGGKINLDAAEKISKACNVSISYVLGDVPEDYDYAAHGIATRRIDNNKPEATAPSLSEADIAAIARRVQFYQSHTPAENELIEDFRLLSFEQQHKVKMLIANLLDKK